MEHIIASNLCKHLNLNKILYDLQHGFREKRSCETQLIQLVEDLARNLTSGKQSDLILLDFSKAFDKVNHLKLLYKLQVHGVQGKTLGWIESFLIGRTQCVVLDGDTSTELPVSSGVTNSLNNSQSWVPYFFFFISMTCLIIYNPMSVFLRMTLQYTWQFKVRKTHLSSKMT